MKIDFDEFQILWYLEGCGYGYGRSRSDGRELHSIGGKRVYIIDAIPTIIESVHGDFARGYIVKTIADLKPCYVVKFRGHFAHGETLNDAYCDAMAKWVRDSPAADRMRALMKQRYDTHSDGPFVSPFLFSGSVSLCNKCSVREFEDYCHHMHGE